MSTWEKYKKMAEDWLDGHDSTDDLVAAFNAFQRDYLALDRAGGSYWHFVMAALEAVEGGGK